MTNINRTGRLTPLQVEIIETLARRGPGSIREVHMQRLPEHRRRGSRSNDSYSNYTTHFKTLEREGIVYKTDLKGSTGWSKWWLAPLGIIRAIDFGADPQKLKRTVFELYPKESGGRLYIGGICDFAIAQGKRWSETTSRENLLWRYIMDTENIRNEIERARKAGRALAFVPFSTVDSETDTKDSSG